MCQASGFCRCGLCAVESERLQVNETDLLHLFIKLTPHVIPGARVERRNIINVKSERGFRVRNGIKGQCDAFCIYRGRHIEIETKAARGVMREAQERWRLWCFAAGTPHMVLKAAKGETPDDTVNRWVAELRAEIAKHV